MHPLLDAPSRRSTPPSVVLFLWLGAPGLTQCRGGTIWSSTPTLLMEAIASPYLLQDREIMWIRTSAPLLDTFLGSKVSLLSVPGHLYRPNPLAPHQRYHCMDLAIRNARFAEMERQGRFYPEVRERGRDVRTFCDHPPNLFRSALRRMRTAWHGMRALIAAAMAWAWLSPLPST